MASSFIAFFYPLSLLLSDSNLCCGKKAKRDSAGKARVAQTRCVKSGRRVQPRPCPAQVCAFKQSVLEPSVAAGDQSVDLPGLSLPPSPSSSLFQPRKVQASGLQAVCPRDVLLERLGCALSFQLFSGLCNSGILGSPGEFFAADTVLFLCWARKVCLSQLLCFPRFCRHI